MPSLRAWVERLLPWYQPALERQRDARTARIVRRSEAARARAERVIAAYRKAEEASDRAGERLIDEVRRPDSDAQ